MCFCSQTTKFCHVFQFYCTFRGGFKAEFCPIWWISGRTEFVFCQWKVPPSHSETLGVELDLHTTKCTTPSCLSPWTASIQPAPVRRSQTLITLWLFGPSVGPINKKLTLVMSKQTLKRSTFSICLFVCAIVPKPLKTPQLHVQRSVETQVKWVLQTHAASLRSLFPHHWHAFESFNFTSVHTELVTHHAGCSDVFGQLVTATLHEQISILRPSVLKKDSWSTFVSLFSADPKITLSFLFSSGFCSLRIFFFTLHGSVVLGKDWEWTFCSAAHEIFCFFKICSFKFCLLY